ncbi:MAG TPA: LacI family DNA-binding transcriptional regulator, partial [bacterium]|nr:LacI family DNA-binding transcriptional regulator [bacterium]
APETRARVQAVVAKLDYAPNALARSLATRRAPIIAAIVHDISDPYFGEITRGIESVAASKNHLVMVCNWLQDPERLLSYLRVLRTMRVAGVIFCGSGLTQDSPLHDEIARQTEALRSYGTRILALAPQTVPMPAVTVDNRHAAELAVDHLIEHGHRRIGHLAGPRTLLTAQHRYEGYLEAMRRAGVMGEEGWVEPAGFGPSDGYDGTLRLLARAPDLTAIVAANDQAAIGALAAAARLGRRVPGDLSLIGIGDIPSLAFMQPPLTEVAVPLRSLGEQGTALLLERGRWKEDNGREPTFLPVRLVSRQSVSPPNRSGTSVERKNA